MHVGEIRVRIHDKGGYVVTTWEGEVTTQGQAVIHDVAVEEWETALEAINKAHAEIVAHRAQASLGLVMPSGAGSDPLDGSN